MNSVVVMAENISNKDEREEEDEEEQGGTAMMSLLASYYGFQEGGQDPNQSSSSLPQADLIDTAHFDPNKYFKDLLNSNTVENLITHDGKMIHDIKSLDSDMQMLVYENYNKFISATETIRRMKDNVEAMEDDMASVRDKMESIAATSATLDKSLYEKRQTIDKLVRVKRLLQRLEFLSELPERLEKMIEQGLYKGAVQLYKKTINVLTNHSHLLSFKKIQERTERMMNDLRSKVMDMLDDPSLDVVKLTQYASILRLMEASSERITEKFLTAHKHRSIRMTKQFLAEFQTKSSNTLTPDGEGGVTIDSTTNSTNKISNNCMTNPNGDDLTVTVVRKFHQNLMVGLIEASKGIHELYLNTKTSATTNNSTSKDDAASAAYDDLQAMIGVVMPEYTKCMTDALKSFFIRYEKTFHDHASLYGDKDSDNNNSTYMDTIRERGGEDSDSSDHWGLEDEKQSWMLLARQAILDCQYLDSATDACRPSTYDAELPHSDGFAENILKTLDAHCEATFSRRIGKVKQQLMQACPKARALCDLRNELSAEIDNPESPSARGILLRRISAVKTMVDNLVETLFAAFGDICADARPVAEIHAVSRVGHADSASMIIWRFCDSIADEMEKYTGGFIGKGGMLAEIYEECIPVGHRLYHGPKHIDEVTFCLLASRVLARASPALSSRLEGALRAHELPTIGSSALRDRCLQRMDATAHMLLITYVEVETSRIAPMVSATVRQSKSRSRVEDETRLTIGEEVIEIVRVIDEMAIQCCIMLSEPPPSTQARLGISLMERDIARRAVHKQGQTGLGHGVQFDIERLFSTRIKVFDCKTLQPTLDSIMGTILKASFKGCLETVRALPPLTVIIRGQIEADISFLKQVSSCLLRDTGETDALVELIMLSVSARSMYPDDAPEASQLSRAVAEGFYTGSRLCVLATGPFQRRAS